MEKGQKQYDFRAVLDAAWEELLDELDLGPVLKELEVGGVFRRSELRDLEESLHKTTEKIVALLELLRDGDHTKYEQFKRCLGASGQERLVEKLEAAERGEYTSIVRKRPRTEEEKLLQVLRKDLREYYRGKESTISVAPLVEQHEADITKFYVRPPMMAYSRPNAFGQKKQSDKKSDEKKSEEKTRIRSYRELLLNGSDPYKGIYVTADAGMGKTSFAKMLAVTWCQAHATEDQPFKIKSEMSCADEIQIKKKVQADFKNVTLQTLHAAGTTLLYTRENRSPDGSHADSINTENISTMEKFDFLFFIKLREYEGSNKCSLHEMIFEKLIPKLQHECRYTREFLENVLCNKRCLIIVDGLDEWSHPKSCGRGEVIPHRKQWPGCTVLTTTRPWKLSFAQLLKADIDRQVEISQLDKTTARELESRAIAFLNENQKSQTDQVAAKSNTKTVTDFENSVPEKILGHILYIPFVLLQMICLWFGNNPIGKSLCEVYSNIIELTLTRWLIKTDSGHTGCKCKHSTEHKNIKLKCMENNRHCRRYIPLLLKIGELAFFALFNDNREESLLFDKDKVLKYLSEEELEQCLKMGLLSQVKDPTSLTEVRLQLYFPHKTLHEFFCTLFIATNWNNAKTGTMSIKQTISSKCSSVSDILEMSEVFLFVCGLNPEVYSDISRPFANIVSKDQSAIDFRNDVLADSDLLEDYQRMQISCFLESIRNQHPECKIVILDMFFHCGMEYEQQALDKILSNSACSLLSLSILSFDEGDDSSSAGRIVRILEQTKFSCLERLNVSECGPTLLQSVLTRAPHTLKYLELRLVCLTDGVLSAISTLNNLQSLFLVLIQEEDSMILLTLPLLTKFILWDCDLGGSTVTLNPEMTSLKTIELYMTTVNIPCYRELFLSISKLPQPIAVKLQMIDMTVGEWRELLFDILGKLPQSIHLDMRGCMGPSAEEWRNIVDDMKASSAFCVRSIDLDRSFAVITFDTVVV